MPDSEEVLSDIVTIVSLLFSDVTVTADSHKYDITLFCQDEYYIPQFTQ